MTTYVEAVMIVAHYKASDKLPKCGKCRGNAELLLTCEDGTFQGVSCSSCWGEHTEFVASALELERQGIALPFCSRCNTEAPGIDHIRAEEI